MQLEIRPAGDADRRQLATLFATVAEERDGIATEPPVDVDAWAERWRLEGTLLAVAEGELVGSLSIDVSRFGFGELGMAVARDWRGRGVGSALVEAGIAWARERGLHKLTLSVFPHHAAAIALYRKFGFVEEGRRVKHYRRACGELWDALEMGLLLCRHQARYASREMNRPCPVRLRHVTPVTRELHVNGPSCRLWP